MVHLGMSFVENIFFDFQKQIIILVCSQTRELKELSFEVFTESL